MLKTTKTYPQIGLLLKALRKSKKLTQTEVARRINISKFCVSRIENGIIKELDTLLIARYASIFDVSIDTLVYLAA
jgi:transcriptional regulator with XRE-family HTH domain